MDPDLCHLPPSCSRSAAWSRGSWRPGKPTTTHSKNPQGAAGVPEGPVWGSCSWENTWSCCRPGKVRAPGDQRRPAEQLHPQHHPPPPSAETPVLPHSVSSILPSPHPSHQPVLLLSPKTSEVHRGYFLLSLLHSAGSFVKPGGPTPTARSQPPRSPEVWPARATWAASAPTELLGAVRPHLGHGSHPAVTEPTSLPPPG